MASFKVPCPSCEAQVLIKDPKLVGTKVECPKCKYRFKVEAPSATPTDAGAKDAKKDKADAGTGKKKAKGGGKAKNKKVLGIALGVAAVALLVIGIIVVFGGGDENKTPSPGGSRPGPGVIGKDQKTDTEVVKETPKTPSLPRSDKEPTNLLPGKSVGVYRFDIGRLRQTSVGNPLFDQTLSDLFRTAMGLDPNGVEQYYHCVVGDKERAPFGLIRLRDPVSEKDVVSRVTGIGAAKVVNAKSLYPVAGNPFLMAVGNALAARSLLSDVYARPLAPDATKQPAEAALLGVCVYDTQTVLVGDRAALEAYLKGLSNGYPEFLTAVKKDAPPPKPKDPAAKDAPKTDPPKVEPPKPPAPVPSNKDYTTNPTYLSVAPELKRLLNVLEDDPAGSPLLVVAENFDNAAYDRKSVQKSYAPFVKVLDPVLTLTRQLGLTVTACTTRQLVATLRFVGGTDEDARKIAFDHLSPGLYDAMPALWLLLPSPIELRNQVKPDQSYLWPVGTAGGPAAPPTGTAFPFTTGAGPSTTGSPTLPMTMGTPGDPNRPPASSQPPSFVELRLSDQVVTLAIHATWSEEVFGKNIGPRVLGYVNQVKGKAAVFAGGATRHALAQAVARYVAQKQQFPRGTAPRPPDTTRFGVPFPPAERLSFFAELLPALGREGIAQGINPGQSWHDRANRTAAESWIPELLVSDYPQTAWRGTTPDHPDLSFGGTNFVAVAGVGLGAARFNPADGTKKGLVGIAGYDWGSKVEEVTDGLANTIYLIQVPPGVSRPWAAGGGATVIGLDPTDPMSELKSARPDGKVGTYAIMGDGTVRWLPADIDPKILLGMATRAGGETLPDLDTVAPRVPPPGAPAEMKAAKP